jgi:DNA-binding CsgD family transcriptional regulator
MSLSASQPLNIQQRKALLGVFSWVRALTEKDHTILAMLCEGKTHAQIADSIECNKKTIQRKVASWCQRMNLPNSRSLVAAYLVHFPERSHTKVPFALLRTIGRTNVVEAILASDRAHSNQASPPLLTSQYSLPGNSSMSDIQPRSDARLNLVNPLFWRDVLENVRELRTNVGFLKSRAAAYREIDSLVFGVGAKSTDAATLDIRIESDDRIWLIAVLTARALQRELLPPATKIEQLYASDGGAQMRRRWEREMEFTLDLSEGAHSRYAGIHCWTLVYPSLLNRLRLHESSDAAAIVKANPLCPIIGFLARLQAFSEDFFDGNSATAGHARYWKQCLDSLLVARAEFLSSHGVEVQSLIKTTLK